MNCNNCGAPMKIVDGQRHYYCDYCDSQKIATVGEGAADGLAMSEEFSELSCPNCPAGNEMLKGLLDEHQVDFCPVCWGVWLESDAFRTLIYNRRLAYQGPDDLPSPINRDALARRRDCSGCHRPMEVHPYYGPGNVAIDSCVPCGRVWLDHGELTTIVRASGSRVNFEKVKLRQIEAKADQRKRIAGSSKSKPTKLFEVFFDLS